MKQVEFKWCTADEALFQQSHEVRKVVFVDEQGFDIAVEFDGLDAQSRHIVMFLQGEVVGTARIFSDTPGELHVGRFAIHKKCRGKGLGLLMMDEIHKEAKKMQMKTLVLNAQHDKMSFYEKAGYACEGDVFLEEGCPHITMRHTLGE